MAKKKRSSPTKTKRGVKKPTSIQKKKSAAAPVDPQVLDLTGEPVHPVVRLPEGDFKMRTPEELTFEQFGRQVSIGKQLIDLAGRVAEDGVMGELQHLVVEASNMILIDLTEKAARNLTPGRYLRINDFFNGLVSED